MEELFLHIVNMSAAASWLILALILLRLILKKAPKALTCALWAIVGLRLLIPFLPESPFSLVPSAQTFPKEFLYAATPEIESGFEFIDNALNPIIADALAPEPIASANPTQINAIIFTFMWLMGMALMLIYMFASFIRVKLRVREAVFTRENIWVCDRVDTPFILGVIRPRIYLPSDIAEGDAVYVIAHEKSHIKRLDFIWKPLGFLSLAVHWFNPLVWLAYVLFCRDIELACDEKVIRELGVSEKKSYSEALLNLSVKKSFVSACPLAFGETGVKTRIKSVLNYKKPAFWVVIAAAILAAAVAFGFATNPYSGQTLDSELQLFLEAQIAEHTKNDKNADCLRLWDKEILGTEKRGKKVSVYMWLYYAEYRINEANEPELISAFHMPMVISAEKSEGGYELLEYWQAEEFWIPEDGAKYSASVRARFPFHLWGKALDSERYAEKQAERVKKKMILTFLQLQAEYFIDAVEFDIDADGEKEYLVLSLGPTSGMYTIALGVKEKGANSYSYNAIYYIYHGAGDFEFAVKNGNLCIKHTEATGKTNIFDMVYDGTDILLFENGEQLDMITAAP